MERDERRSRICCLDGRDGGGDFRSFLGYEVEHRSDISPHTRRAAGFSGAHAGGVTGGGEGCAGCRTSGKQKIRSHFRPHLLITPTSPEVASRAYLSVVFVVV